MNRNLHQVSVSTTTLFIVLFFSAMFVASFNSLLPSLKSLGFLAVFSLLSIAPLLFLYYITVIKEIHRILAIISIPFVLFLFTMFIGSFISRSGDTFQYIFQFSTIVLFFMLSSLIKWNEQRIILAKVLSVWLFLIILPIIADIRLIGAYMVLPIFFILLNKKKSAINLILILASIYLIYLAGMRAVFLLIIFSTVTFFIWKFISKTKMRYSLFFTGLVAGLLSFVFIYPKMIYWSKFHIIESYVNQYTGKSLMSGRNRIWDDLTYLINTKPLFGHGTGVLPRNFLNSDLSSHNLYLQTALQNGWIGLILLFIMFFVIWLGYYKTKELYSTRLSASFFIGILVYQSFEVVLTQNKMDTAFIFWLIMSVGISNNIYKSKRPIGSFHS